MSDRKAAKRKVKKNIPAGICHIQATFNNTIVTMTDLAGNVVSWSSAGVLRFKGSRKVRHLQRSWLQRTLLIKHVSMA